VLPIRLPPLRERLEDLEALVEALADDIARRSGMPHKSLAPEALDLLAAQPWPGNIRELRNVLEQATLMTDEQHLAAQHFAAALPLAVRAAGGAAPLGPGAGASLAPSAQPATLARRGAAAAPADAADVAHASFAATPPALLRPLAEQVNEVEDAAIAAALAATGGNRVAAARLLCMSRAALYAKLTRQPSVPRDHAAGPGCT